MSETTDDLEQTLMLAAAAADSRQYDGDPDNTQGNNDENSEEIHFYREQETVADPPKNALKRKRRLEEEPNDSPKKNIKTDYNAEQSQNNHKQHASTKRKHDESSQEETQKIESSSHSQVVATHYNLIEDKGLAERAKSRIIYLKNFHNWIKSMLINEYLTKIREKKKQHNPPILVHDMCCGKGGDLLKWKKGSITSLICSDIAEISLEHCQQRYADMKRRARNERGGGNIYSLEVIPGDSTKVRLREKFKDPSTKLDLVSCQFAFHYSFESLPQAECMMRNAAECLQPGGYFIGTMPDSNEIIARARKSETGTFGNDIFNIVLDFDSNRPPLFGAKYHFQLDGAVDCPEFLVHFPTFVKLAKKYGLKFVRKEKFREFFERMKIEGKHLLTAMHSLESYPPHNTAKPNGCAADDYSHAEEFLERNQDKNNSQVGTLSKSEWEASCKYLFPTS